MRWGSEGRLPDRNGKCWMSELRFSWVDTNGRACGIFRWRRSSVVKIQTSWPFPLPRFFDGRRDGGLIPRSFRLRIFKSLCVGRAGAIESNGEEGAALPRRWREKLTDEELNGLGERACPRAPSGAPRARHIENSTGLRPHFFQLSPRGRVLVHPGAGALPETMALSRLWQGGGAASLVEFVIPRRLVLQVACSRSFCGRALLYVLQRDWRFIEPCEVR